MAPPEIDIAELSENQQLALQQFTSVTDQELEAAVPLLQRSEWNVQVIKPESTCLATKLISCE